MIDPPLSDDSRSSCASSASRSNGRRKTALAPVNAASEPHAAQRAVPPAKEARRGEGGSVIDSFNMVIFMETLACIWMPRDEKKQKEFFTVVLTALTAFEPKDEIEGMIAAQVVALHFGAMEALRRSMIRDQPADAAAGSARMARTSPAP